MKLNLIQCINQEVSTVEFGGISFQQTMSGILIGTGGIKTWKTSSDFSRQASSFVGDVHITEYSSFCGSDGNGWCTLIWNMNAREGGSLERGWNW